MLAQRRAKSRTSSGCALHAPAGAAASKAALLKNLSGTHLRWRWSTLTSILFGQKVFRRFCPKGDICKKTAERTSWNSPLTVRLQPDHKFCPLSSSGSLLERAGGFQRGRLWCGSNQPQRPFGRILWLLSWRDKKVTYCSILQQNLYGRNNFYATDSRFRVSEAQGASGIVQDPLYHPRGGY